MDLFVEKLKKTLPEEAIKKDEPMKDHTTFKIGGPADYFLMPSPDELPGLLSFLKEEGKSFHVIGNGSNILVGDRGIRGAVICLGRRFDEISVKGNMIRARAGTLLSAVAKKASENSLSGLEFASGIPGSVGGGLIMNAGAYGGELKDVLKSVTVFFPDGEIRTLGREGYGGRYRGSKVADEGGIVLSSEFVLEEKDSGLILEKMKELNQKRTQKQPLSLASAGSTFKRPEGHFAAKLIEDAGLKGYIVGGAMVSEKHAGFVVNFDRACASDVRTLMEHVTEKVYAATGVRLEPEVKFIGEF